MGVVKIPEKVITTCDCCGRVKEDNRKAFTMSAKIHFQSAGLDYQGEPVGPGDDSTSIFCNSCYDNVKQGLIDYLKREAK